MSASYSCVRVCVLKIGVITKANIAASSMTTGSTAVSPTPRTSQAAPHFLNAASSVHRNNATGKSNLHESSVSMNLTAEYMSKS